ncbi:MULTISPECIES: hypothetical protein [unclassified Streptomyces]|uniref:hypothetical protein n=1 Tax=unclassified Streptomyces TaxID=2593676 RepID=UPI0040431E1D
MFALVSCGERGRAHPVEPWPPSPSPTATHTSGTQETRSTHFDAFAVPLKPGAEISSVTLPDLGSAARRNVPVLHPFGMALRDTTTAPRRRQVNRHAELSRRRPV